MPSQLYNNSNVEFIAARNFTYAGKDYEIGESVPQDEIVHSLEVLVRTRRVIPVVESTETKPRHFHREVRIKSDILDRLGVKEQPKKAAKKDGPFNPAEHNVDEVLEYLTADGISDEDYERVLQAEREGKARKGILGDE